MKPTFSITHCRKCILPIFIICITSLLFLKIQIFQNRSIAENYNYILPINHLHQISPNDNDIIKNAVINSDRDYIDDNSIGSKSGEKRNRIPNIVHFIFGMSEDFGGRPFGIVHYLAIKSAKMIHKPDAIYIHHVFEPTNYWWNQTKLLGEIKNNNEKKIEIKFLKVEKINEIFGNRVNSFAHKADILRLKIMKDIGGIYLDTDVISLRPLANEWLQEGPDFIMGQEGEGAFHGLCNAVMIGAPNSTFVQKWWNEYRNFSDNVWQEFSVELPRKLWLLNPEDIRVLGHTRFFWPLWSDNHVRMVHSLEKPLKYDFEKEGNYMYHAWSNVAKYYLNLTQEFIMNTDTPFNVAVRKFLVDL